MKKRNWKASVTVTAVPRGVGQKTIEGLHFFCTKRRGELAEQVREMILDEIKIFFGPEEGEQAASPQVQSFTVMTTVEFER